MQLKILLPFKIFVNEQDVRRLVVETTEGSYGILPNRLDLVAALVPGILSYESKLGQEIFVALDKGVMVKIGSEVMISVRNAVRGESLGGLRVAIEKSFDQMSESQKKLRTVTAKLESSFFRKFQEFKNG